MQSHLLWSFIRRRYLCTPTVCSDAHRTLTGSTEPTTCVLDPVKTAMEKRQSRKRERYWRQTLRPRSRHIRWHIMCVWKKILRGQAVWGGCKQLSWEHVRATVLVVRSVDARAQTNCLFGTGAKKHELPPASQPASVSVSVKGRVYKVYYSSTSLYGEWSECFACCTLFDSG